MKPGEKGVALARASGDAGRLDSRSCDAVTARPSTAGTICMSADSSAGMIAGTMTAGTREYRMRSLTASSATSLGYPRGVSRVGGFSAPAGCGPEACACGADSMLPILPKLSRELGDRSAVLLSAPRSLLAETRKLLLAMVL